MSGKLPRAKCPVCGLSTPVNADGRFRKHRRTDRLRWLTVPCEGSGTSGAEQ